MDKIFKLKMVVMQKAINFQIFRGLAALDPLRKGGGVNGNR